MEIRATTTICDIQDGYVHVGWELPGSSLGYVLITLPETDEPSTDEFFGHNHHVEILDQRHGRYGGLDHLAVQGDRRVTLRTNYEIPNVDAELNIICASPIAADALAQLRRAEALVERPMGMEKSG